MVQNLKWIILIIFLIVNYENIKNDKRLLIKYLIIFAIIISLMGVIGVAIAYIGFNINNDLLFRIGMELCNLSIFQFINYQITFA